MAQELSTVTLVKSKGQPVVEVIFGHAHLGNYRFFLWDAKGKNPVALAHGNNIDDVLDTFSVPHSATDLDQRILSFELIVQAAEAKPGQLYSVTITVRQKGEVCEGGLIQEMGSFTDVKSIIGFRRFTV